MIGDFVKMRRVPKSKPIRAYRAWCRCGAESYPRLHSLFFGLLSTDWAKPVSVPSPDWDSDDGLYAYKNRAHALDLIAANPSRVAGSVLLWGIVAEHKDGYRAEHAKVCRLWRTK